MDTRQYRPVPLPGAAQALLDAGSTAPERADREDHERDLTALRARLDDETFMAAWAAGCAAPVARSIADALDEANRYRAAGR